jgi:nitroimidazol reductase NimA-like FMN-containing flavoprotein (pyridoxamine 5'-phosphate oxidase superfamily)
MAKQVLEQVKIDKLLDRAQIGHFTTIDADGRPYTVPVHFVRDGSAIIIHSRKSGRKIENAAANPNVCFQVDELQETVSDGASTLCNIYSIYESVVCEGKATILSDPKEVRAALYLIVDKYAPEMKDMPMPEKSVEVTRIIKIDTDRISGKAYDRNMR